MGEGGVVGIEFLGTDWLGSISNCHHLKFKELNSLTVGMYVWPEQENGDSI